MPGGGYQPLEIIQGDDQEEPTETEKFREAAKGGSIREEVVCLGLLDTGLRASELAHMKESWLKWRGGMLYVDVQQYEKCRLGSSEHPDTTKRDEPCWYCKNRVHKDWLPAKHKLPDGGDCWHPKSEAGYKGRKVPVSEDHTADVLTTYFRVYDVIGTPQQIRGAVRRVAKRAGIHEVETVVDEDGNEKEEHWPTPHDLRDTYGTKLAEMGFTRDEIKAPMGHERIDQADDYIELSGRGAASTFDEKYDREKLDG